MLESEIVSDRFGSGAIHCSEATAARLPPAFALSARGAINIEGKGEMRTFLLSPPATDINVSTGGAT